MKEQSDVSKKNFINDKSFKIEVREISWKGDYLPLPSPSLSSSPPPLALFLNLSLYQYENQHYLIFKEKNNNKIFQINQLKDFAIHKPYPSAILTDDEYKLFSIKHKSTPVIEWLKENPKDCALKDYLFILFTSIGEPEYELFQHSHDWENAEVIQFNNKNYLCFKKERNRYKLIDIEVLNNPELAKKYKYHSITYLSFNLLLDHGIILTQNLLDWYKDNSARCALLSWEIQSSCNKLLNAIETSNCRLLEIALASGLIKANEPLTFEGKSLVLPLSKVFKKIKEKGYTKDVEEIVSILISYGASIFDKLPGSRETLVVELLDIGNEKRFETCCGKSNLRDNCLRIKMYIETEEMLNSIANNPKAYTLYSKYICKASFGIPIEKDRIEQIDPPTMLGHITQTVSANIPRVSIS